MTRRLPVAAFVMVVAITAAWWALALWPTGPAAPAWLERTREVCFGVSRNGLPDAAGWAVLISEPFGMLAFLGLVWRDDLVETLGDLRRTTRGRIALGAASVALASGICAATVRVAMATPTSVTFDAGSTAEPVPDRLDRTAPALSLVDQHGTTVRLEDFRGRPVMIAFAYAHCQTVCPLLVHDAIAAMERAKESDPALLIVTLDPWRDTPARLAAITRAWSLPAGVRLLGGTVAEVERTLEGWNIPRARDGNTGDIVHPTSVYFIDKHGRLAFIASGDASRLAAIIGRL